MTLENIGEGEDALLCLTDLTSCCRPPYTDSLGQSALGNWFFPNGTRVPSSGSQWDLHRTRGNMVVLLHRRRGGVDGVYYCVVPDAMNVTQTIYIGIYTASTGEWYTYTEINQDYIVWPRCKCKVLYTDVFARPMEALDISIISAMFHLPHKFISITSNITIQSFHQHSVISFFLIP